MNAKISSWILFATVGAMMLTAVPAFSQQTSETGYKIGVVNRNQVFEECAMKKAKYDYLESEKTKRDLILDPQIEQLRKEDEAKRAAFSSLTPEQIETWAAERKRREIDIKAQKDKYQTELDEMTNSALREIADKMQDVIEALAVEKNFHLILEGDTNPSANNPVIYFHEVMNLTPEVIVRMDAEFKKTSASATDPAKSTKKKG